MYFYKEQITVYVKGLHVISHTNRNVTARCRISDKRTNYSCLFVFDQSFISQHLLCKNHHSQQQQQQQISIIIINARTLRCVQQWGNATEFPQTQPSQITLSGPLRNRLERIADLISVVVVIEQTNAPPTNRRKRPLPSLPLRRSLKMGQLKHTHAIVDFKARSDNSGCC